jgi:hypothetical protein
MFGVAACALFVSEAALAQSTSSLTQGWGPDAQLTGGVGFGVPEHLQNPFLGRVRLGALYAREPWIGAAGLTCELGALGKLGFGAELELDTWSGWFAELGLARVSDEHFQTHATLGFTVFGIEWEHRFADARPSDAVLLEVRLPLGMWWFMNRRKAAEQARARGSSSAREVDAAQPKTADEVARAHPPRSLLGRPLAPRPLQPSEAAAASGAAASGPTASATASNPSAPATAPSRAASGPTASAPASNPSAPAAALPPMAAGAPSAGPAPRNPAADIALAAAAAASARGDFSQASLEYGRAYALSPEPAILLQLSAAEEAQGSSRQAVADLRRYLTSPELSPERRHAAEAHFLEVEQRVPKLRLLLSGGRGDEVLALDGRSEAGLALGYDAPLDPGSHTLTVTRAGREIARRDFSVQAGELTRLEIALP